MSTQPDEGNGDSTTKLKILRNSLLDEIFKAVGASESGLLRRLFWPLFWVPAQRFSKIGYRFNQIVTTSGFREAARWLLPHFIGDYIIEGGEDIPEVGPLLIASNHPGTVDALMIAAHIPRDDLKMIAGDIPFLRFLPAVGRHMMHIAQDAHVRMAVLRESMRHLEQGGAVLLFPSGGIDPDPAFMPHAYETLGTWSRSIGLMLRKVPRASVLISIVSGLLAPIFLRNPIPKVRKKPRDRQRIAEFMQIIYQITFPFKLPLSPKISYSQVLSLGVTNRDDVHNALQTIIQEAKQLYRDHMTNR